MPAYFGPWEGDAWERLLAARPAVIVINPASGPGERAHGGYRELVARFAITDTAVLGYVTTSYLAKPIASCATEAARHTDWYGVHGIFWDEVPAERERGRVAALRSLRSIAGSGPGVRCVFNPGRPVSRGWYRSLSDSVFVTFEGPASAYDVVDVRGPSDRQCHLVHSADGDPVLPLPGVGFAYVTPDRPPNPWDVFA